MLERDIVKRIKEYLNGLDETFVWKNHGGQYSAAGIPDVIGSYRGRFIGVEVKRPGKKATKLQQVVIDKIKETGGISFVATSVNDVKEVLNEY